MNHIFLWSAGPRTRFLKVMVLESKICGLSLENSTYTGKEESLALLFWVAKLHKTHPQTFLPNSIRLRGTEVFCAGQTDYINFKGNLLILLKIQHYFYGRLEQLQDFFFPPLFCPLVYYWQREQMMSVLMKLCRLMLECDLLGLARGI